jgi:hypothetical protein
MAGSRSRPRPSPALAPSASRRRLPALPAFVVARVPWPLSPHTFISGERGQNRGTAPKTATRGVGTGTPARARAIGAYRLSTNRHSPTPVRQCDRRRCRPARGDLHVDVGGLVVAGGPDDGRLPDTATEEPNSSSSVAAGSDSVVVGVVGQPEGRPGQASVFERALRLWRRSAGSS